MAPRVLLIGWDAADWQMIHPLVDAGRMPVLARLIEGGVMGNLRSLQPMLSPLLWTSIATGKRATHHGIHGFAEVAADGSRVRPVQSTSRTTKALWNMASQAGLRTHAVGWFASHPAEAIDGVCLSNQFALAAAGTTESDWPILPGCVEPVSLGASLAELRLHPSEIDDSLLDGFIPGLPGLDRTNPVVIRLVEALRTRLAECISIQAAATELIEHEPWDFASVCFECIDQVGHDFMAFHPPRLPAVHPAAFAAFSGVMNATYRFHDEMLGRLLELAGPGTHVMLVSDHGFLSDHLRPSQPVEPAQWHRAQGVFLLQGPGIRRDERIDGATLLDVAPTILTLLGLPVGNDMPGCVLIQAFERPPAIEQVDSWDKMGPARSPDSDGPIAPGADLPAEQAALRQLVELGYLAPPSETLQRDIELVFAEQRFNLAVSWLDGGRPDLALPLAAGLVRENAAESRYAALLGHLGLVGGDSAAVAEAVATLAQNHPGHPRLPWIRGLRAWAEGNMPVALTELEAALAGSPNHGWLHCRVGRVRLRLRDWAGAEVAFQRALALDPTLAEACYGLSVAIPRQARPAEGIEYGLRAIELCHDFPEAHFQLGAILSRLGWFDRAVTALELCLTMRPGFALAHRYLAAIYARLGRTAEAGRHRSEADRLVAEKVAQPPVD